MTCLPLPFLPLFSVLVLDFIHEEVLELQEMWEKDADSASNLYGDWIKCQ